ncbi:MAG: glycosyltransferase family 4 protein [Gemmataceae bacterium]|nr:glycosyltransferase family 4 protein [Gemmataceae bacterium]MCS7270385.1 glycosyltransferase family 4 protein [Gemmataceae bacterium]MDW8242064.1 glycosyltransferase family 4 protein [Thermogemmata sp.]
MHLVALVEDEDHVCCRYRLKALQPLWAAAGHAVVFRRLPRGLWRRWFWDPLLSRADGVIVQRKLLPCWAVDRLRRYARRLIYDFDDALWLRDSYARGGLTDPRRQRRFSHLVRRCDLVVAGNAFLAAAVQRWAPATPVVVIPTCVDPRRYPLAEHHVRPVEQQRLVWIGSRSTLQGLCRFRETLTQLGQALPGIRLKLICDQPLAVAHLPVDFVPWSAATEAQELATADVGISWLPDDDWSRGKCGLKVLQYQAAGLPVVVNPVGVQAEMVQPGQTGYWARSAPEWVAAVQRLVMDAELRRRLGQAGRLQVEQRYSVEMASSLWLEALARWVAPRRQTG